ncbi:hypothetical protein BJ322DRAFT_708870 [Thelephora terrestris]|uniref:TM7S3/TM198-like domain-containing protein n=1 Tax=Thelephora terrestris TaxID=56493 RepID=A0A9P6HHW6_9AGAM|nr:hypothetical protein BJ322DRAFT_708870 [Thelephora terrestris]
MLGLIHPLLRAAVLVLGLASLAVVEAQSSSNSSSQTPSPTISFSVSTTTSVSNLVSGLSTIQVSSVFPVTYLYPLSASSTTPTATASPSATSSPAQIRLDTTLDPGFGVLGAILILTGIPSAFLGHKNRWTSFFLIGFYTLSLVCLVLILQFGVLQQVHPPSSTLRGLFVLACVVAGGAGGAITIFFWKLSRYLIGGWGGFSLALFIQCFRDGGLIREISYRWIMFIGVSVIGFCICTIPKIHYHVMLVSTGFVGATAVMLGIDCFTTAGLKEFYMWNLGFRSLFPKYSGNGIQFPVTQVMQIELGLMVAVALMGIALQLRILKLLQRKLKEISEMQKRQNEEEERRAADRFAGLDMEKQEWEAQRKSVLQHGRNDSDLSGVALLEGKGSAPGSPQPDDYNTLVNGQRPRYQSGVSDLMTEEGRRSQSPGAIPALDLGRGIEGTVPQDYLADSKEISRIEEEVRTREKLRQEIEDIRKSIVYLEDAAPPRSNRPSLASRTDVIGYRDGSRSRTNSLELGAMMRSSSTGVTRPKSAPLPEDWDAYVRDRKLLQPPSGISAPIQTSAPPMTQRTSMSAALLDAVANRQKIESMLGVKPSLPVEGSSSHSYQLIPQRSQDSEDAALAFAVPSTRTPHVRSKSAGLPVTILPPQKASTHQPTQGDKTPPPRVATYEELAERHQRKIRDMQAPLTKAEREAAELGDAKKRWERAKALEKESVTKRQADMVAALAREEKKKKKEQRGGSGSGPELAADIDNAEQTRSLSADKLGTLPGGSINPNSKRMSVMKVEDWKRSQMEQASPDEMGMKKRESVPFPRNASTNQRRSGSGFLVRDPPR